MSAPLLTAREVSEVLGDHPETVLRWVRRGKLPAVRLPSGQLRFREDALDAWLAERVTPTRGDVTQPAGRHPAAIVIGVTQPEDEEEE